MKNKTKQDPMMQYANTYNQARHELYITKRFDRAEKLFRRLYRIMRQQAQQNNEQFDPANVFADLGEVYFARKRHGRALWYYQTAERLFGPVDPRWCALETVWTAQAKVHAARGNYAKANALYEKAIASIAPKATDANNRSILSGVVREFAALLSKQSRGCEAQIYTHLAEELRKLAAQEGFA